MRRLALLALVLAVPACTESPRSAHAETAGARQQREVDVEVDSALDAELARFREPLPAVDTFAFAAESRDALVRTFVASLGRADTVALARLHVSRAEWAWLVYPGSRLTRPPYRQRPGIAWMLRIEPSNVGLGRVLARRGGQPMAMIRWACTDGPTLDGATREWGGCTITWRSAGEERTERLFGSIVEHDGRFKIGSYANQF